VTDFRLVDAAEVARRLSVDRAFVYEHAFELGARRLGSGPRARLRFDLREVERWVDSCSPSRLSESPENRVVEPIRRRRRRPALGTNVDLLPIRGQKEAA
jgi:hypothetical protein